MQRKEGFIVRIQIRNEQGRVVGEIDAITYKGLLSLAHEEGLRLIKTRLLQVPSETNGRTAIVHAVACTRRGKFGGIGDASPTNVNARIAPHILLMAETRAIARALRAAVNVGEVAIEELADEVTATPDNLPTNGGTLPAAEHEPAPLMRGRVASPSDANTADRRAMSDEQRKLLFRLAFELGETRETARDRVVAALQTERLEQATRADASRAIDVLKQELAAHQGNGKSSKEALHGA